LMIQKKAVILSGTLLRPVSVVTGRTVGSTG
jgi:hypothetical protein